MGGRRTARGKREREGRGRCRACELSSGRRRHWKNRTEINRSVFFAELEHELSLSLVLSQFSRLSSLSLSLRRPTRLASFCHPPSRLNASHSFTRALSPSVLLLVFQHLSCLPSLPLLPRLAPFLSRAPGVYPVIARPSRTTALDFQRRSLDFYIIPPFPRSISFRTAFLLRLCCATSEPVTYLCIILNRSYYLISVLSPCCISRH